MRSLGMSPPQFATHTSCRTVGELIEALSDFHPDAPLVEVRYADRGYGGGRSVTHVRINVTDSFDGPSLSYFATRRHASR